MPDMWMDVDTAIASAPVNILPLVDDTDFKTIEASVAYNAAGMALKWNFTTTAGVTTQTAVTPTTSGNYDWTNLGNGMYAIEITASGGASINNDTEGVGWFSGVATGVLPWRGPTIGFRAAALNNSLIDAGTTGLLAPTTAARTLDVTAGGNAGIDWANVEAPTTTLALTGTTIATTQKVDVETIKTNPVVNAGTVTFPTNSTLASTTNIAAGTITTVTTVTTATNLTNAPTNGDFTTTMKTSIGTAVAASAVASVTGNVGGNVVGSVGSVVGAVGSVTGAVGSVTGAVGSVTGNVGGNVTGSIGSLATQAKADVNAECDTALTDYGALQPTTAGRKLDVTATGGAGIDWSNVEAPTTAVNLSGTNIATDQIVASVSGAVGSVTGNVGGNVVGSVGSVTVVNDKTGYAIGVGGIASTAFAAGAIDNAALATDAIGAAELAQSACQEIADEFLNRDLAGGGSGNTRNVRNALRPLRNKVDIVAGVVTIYAENDTDAAWTADIVRTAGNPISSVDPT